jgi:hypothetical protein
MTEPKQAIEPQPASRFRKAVTGGARIMKVASCFLTVLLLGLAPAWALINVRFTPADLIRGAHQVCVVRLAPVKDKVVVAEVVETIRGKAPANPKLTLNFDPDGELTADGLNAVLPITALLVLSAPEDLAPARDPVGALLVGNEWLAVFRRDGKWVLDLDQQGLSAIWAGSAINLAAGARYVQTDPTASFPVRSDLV